jgi:hypothetical protein
METKAIQNDARKAQRERRLGPAAACALCGVTTPEALMRVNRTLLERHHPGCKEHEPDLTIPVCRNCHAGLTARQHAAGVVFQTQQTLPERLAAMLQALGVFFIDLGNTLIAWAAMMIGFVAGLDTTYPEWRDNSWALV